MCLVCLFVCMHVCLSFYVRAWLCVCVCVCVHRSITYFGPRNIDNLSWDSWDDKTQSLKILDAKKLERSNYVMRVYRLFVWVRGCVGWGALFLALSHSRVFSSALFLSLSCSRSLSFSFSFSLFFSLSRVTSTVSHTRPWRMHRQRSCQSSH